MWGQWRGDILGAKSGKQHAIVNIDIDRPTDAAVHVTGEDGGIFFARLDGRGAIAGRVVDCCRGSCGEPRFKSIDGDISGSLDANGFLEGKWSTPFDQGSFTLTRRDTAQSATRRGTHLSWSSFKKMVVTTVERHSVIWRGQSTTLWPLRTSLHRKHCFDLWNYSRSSVPLLHSAIEDTVSERFDLADARQHGQVIDVARHHGFPAPIVDFTRSPLVAAYFAFKNVPGNPKAKDRVRIFKLDEKAVPRPNSTIFLHEFVPTVATLQLPPYRNPRSAQQMSLYVFSNVRVR